MPPAPHPLLDIWRQRADWLDGRLVIAPRNAFYSDHAPIEMRHSAARIVQILLTDGRHRRDRRPQLSRKARTK